MHAELRCYYCTQLIANSDDAQRIERRTFAHTACAFVVNDKYFLALEQLPYKDGTSLPDKSLGIEHHADALGYLVAWEFPIAPPGVVIVKYVV